MTDKHDGGPAFPSDMLINGSVKGSKPYSGMSLRDWFAGQALAGIAGPSADGFSLSPQDSAVWAYQYANAMIAARSEAGK